MLRQEAVTNGEMGPVLSEFLVEFLPFEEEARDMIESVRLILLAGYLDEGGRKKLWAKGKYKNAYYVGFLHAVPDDLPETQSPHPEWEDVHDKLQGLVDQNNPYAVLLCRLLSAAGQAFLATVETVLRKPANQDVVISLLRAIDTYHRSIQLEKNGLSDVGEIIKKADRIISDGLDGRTNNQGLELMLSTVPGFADKVHAMLVLSMTDELVVDPIFSRTDAIGTVMRRRLEPVSEPLLQNIEKLKGV